MKHEQEASALDPRAAGPADIPLPPGPYQGVFDYILGITFEIWEQRQVDRIHAYYGTDVEVFSLEGITRGAEAMVAGTHAMLEAFPDRLLLGEDVVWRGDLQNGFSSHRILSPMTNLGPTPFGPATQRRVQIMNIADCEIRDGRITREWLLRDNLALVRQLGFDVDHAVRRLQERLDDDFRSWLEGEFSRTERQRSGTPYGDADDPVVDFARRALECCWTTGDAREFESLYAPYCVLQRAPVRIHSGRPAISDHYTKWRRAFPAATICVDHVCSQPFTEGGSHIAVRWSVAGRQEGPIGEHPGSGAPVYIVGVTHWRVIGGRIVTEWTVFDELAVLAQAAHWNG